MIARRDRARKESPLRAVMAMEMFATVLGTIARFSFTRLGGVARTQSYFNSDFRSGGMEIGLGTRLGRLSETGKGSEKRDVT